LDPMRPFVLRRKASGVTGSVTGFALGRFCYLFTSILAAALLILLTTSDQEILVSLCTLVALVVLIRDSYIEEPEFETVSVSRVEHLNDHWYSEHDHRDPRFKSTDMLGSDPRLTQVTLDLEVVHVRATKGEKISLILPVQRVLTVSQTLVSMVLAAYGGVPWSPELALTISDKWKTLAWLNLPLGIPWKPDTLLYLQYRFQHESVLRHECVDTQQDGTEQILRDQNFWSCPFVKDQLTNGFGVLGTQ